MKASQAGLVRTLALACCLAPAVRFRVDKSCRNLSVSWISLAGYARATGSYKAERALGLFALPNQNLRGTLG